MLGELTYSCLAGIDRNAYFSCYLNDFFQKLQQELLTLVNNVAIVHISPVELYAPDNFYVIVNPNRISDTSGLPPNIFNALLSARSRSYPKSLSSRSVISFLIL